MNTLMMSLYSMLFSNGSASSLWGANPLQSRVNAYAAEIGADQTQIAAYQKLDSALSTFQSAMASLETQAGVSPALATSSNTTVALAAATATAATGSYNVGVTQLAAQQTVTSGAVADPNVTVVGSGTLTIQLGTYNSGTNSFTAGSSPAVSVTVTNGSLNSIASAINSAGAGVTATVTKDVAGYHLSLTSNATGQANAFKVSVADADGINTDMSGLSQLAYDPTAAVGAGKNLTLTQAAQDAILSVNGVTTTSATNGGITVGSGVSVSVAQTGTTTVNVSLNYASLQSAAQNFVNAYNSLHTTLNGLTGPGGALAGDAVTANLAMNLSGGAFKTLAASGSFNNLAQIGIGENTDGTLSLNSSALQTAFNTDPTGTVSLLNQAALSFDTTANQYTQSGGSIPSSIQALQNQVTLLQSAEAGAAMGNSLASPQLFGAQRYQLMSMLMQQDMLQPLFSNGTSSQGASLTSLFV